jgi:predicted O-methyltransferase YrrM
MTIDVAEFGGRQVVGFMSEGNFKRLDWLIITYEIQSIIELGAFVGLSTCFFAERVKRVITIDNFDVESQDYPRYLRPIHELAAQDQYAEFLRNTIVFPNITGIHMDFWQAAELPLEADMVYIDAAMPYEKFSELVDLWVPKARKVIAGDDTQAPGVRQKAKEMGALHKKQRTWWKVL